MGSRARMRVSVVLAGLLLCGCVGGDDGSGQSANPPSRSPSDSAAARDGTSSTVPSAPQVYEAEIEVGSDPGYAAVGAGSVWVGNHSDATVSRVDPTTNRVIATVEIDGEPTGMLFAFDGVWTFAAMTGLLHRIDPATNEVVAKIRLEGTGGGINGLTTDGASVWVSENSGFAYRIDPTTNSAAARVQVLKDGCGPGANLTFSGSAIWYACWDLPYLWKIDPGKERVIRRFKLGGMVGSPADGGEIVWVPSMAQGVVLGVDPTNGRVEERVAVGGAVEQVRLDGTTMWARVSDTELAQVDLRQERIVERYELPSAPVPGGGLVVGFDSVWVMNFGTGTVWRISRGDR